VTVELPRQEKNDAGAIRSSNIFRQPLTLDGSEIKVGDRPCSRTTELAFGKAFGIAIKELTERPDYEAAVSALKRSA
jgi:hypothetical protein